MEKTENITLYIQGIAKEDIEKLMQVAEELATNVDIVPF